MNQKSDSGGDIRVNSLRGAWGYMRRHQIGDETRAGILELAEEAQSKFLIHLCFDNKVKGVLDNLLQSATGLFSSDPAFWKEDIEEWTFEAFC